jgi:hypothetical protein
MLVTGSSHAPTAVVLLVDLYRRVRQGADDEELRTAATSAPNSKMRA